MVFLLELLPVILILILVVTLVMTCLRWARERRSYRQTHNVIELHSQRRELEQRVFSHLTPAEQKLPWTLDDLKSLDEIYSERKT